MVDVSIIIPYNVDRGYIDQAIRSVHDQDYCGKIELILSQSPGNVSYNLNEGIKMAKGKHIKYLCEDDMLTPQSIRESVTALQGHDLIHGNAYNLINEVKRAQLPRMEFPTLSDMLHSNVIHGGTLMYKREVFEKVGLFDESLTCAEEYEFNMRCLKAGLILGYCPEFLYIYRRHDQQKSLGKGVDQIERAKRIEAIKDKFR